LHLVIVPPMMAPLPNLWYTPTSQSVIVPPEMVKAPFCMPFSLSSKPLDKPILVALIVPPFMVKVPPLSFSTPYTSPLTVPPDIEALPPLLTPIPILSLPVALIVPLSMPKRDPSFTITPALPSSPLTLMAPSYMLKEPPDITLTPILKPSIVTFLYMLRLPVSGFPPTLTHV